MSKLGSRAFLSTNQTKFFKPYFPGEAITNRLVNWLHLVVIWLDGRLEYRVEFDVRARPELLINELKGKHISPDKVKEIRCAKMYEERFFNWFEGSEIFYHTFMFSIYEQQIKFTQPTVFNARRKEECIMLVDGITGDRDTIDVFLSNAQKRWEKFKPIIETLKWVRKGDFQKNCEKFYSAYIESGEFIPHTREYYSTDDPYIKFMLLIFSLGIEKEMAKRISTQAKKTLRQCLPRKTKEKGQVNVLICNSTIEKLEKLCKANKISKAKLITEIIENYSKYNKEIDSAIQRAKIEILSAESLPPPGIIQATSPPHGRTGVGIDNSHAKTKEKNNIPDTRPNRLEQRPYELGISGSDHAPSIASDSSHDVFVEKTAKPSPTTTKSFTNQSEEIFSQNSINQKFQNISNYKKRT